jgi:hypothetical protein
MPDVHVDKGEPIDDTAPVEDNALVPDPQEEPPRSPQVGMPELDLNVDTHPCPHRMSLTMMGTLSTCLNPNMETKMVSRKMMMQLLGMRLNQMIYLVDPMTGTQMIWCPIWMRFGLLLLRLVGRNVRRARDGVILKSTTTKGGLL